MSAGYVCGCCAGTETATPVPSYNRPGLPELAYRVGTHGRFLRSMLARLSSSAHPRLARLTTRDPDDPSVALLDCWAVIGDVLTFYQQRIANEGYLRTATEQESLIQLGRLVGYRPRPPLGSSGYLAYTLDPGARATIPAGSQAKSVPDQGQLPQTFETTEELEAREEWNTLLVRRDRPPVIIPDNASDLRQVALAGTATVLRAGDRMLFLFGSAGDPAVRVVDRFEPDFERNRTVVTLGPPATDFETAIGALQDAIEAALADRPDSPLTADTRTELEAMALLIDNRTATDFLFDALTDLVRILPEQAAVARARATGAVVALYDTSVAAVVAAGEVALELSGAATGRRPPEIEYLRSLAERLVCPGEANLDDPRCRDADALVALVPLLPALRKPPSRPPRNARDLEPQVEELFAPGSDVLLRLLGATDPLVSANLYRAVANERVASPPPLSNLQVMRIKARPFIGPRDDGQEPVIGVAGEEQTHNLKLDAVYDGILPGSYIVAETSGQTIVRLVTAVAERRVSIGNDVLVAVTELTVAGPWFDQVDERDVDDTEVTVYAQGEPLALAGEQLTDDVAGNRIELTRPYDGLRPGRWLIVSGERTDVPYTSGVPGTELVMVGGIQQTVDPDLADDKTHVTLILVNPLAYTYKRDTVQIYGNVVEATQGETRNDVLGSGDATRAGQSFPLHQVTVQAPLTWLPADNPLGARNALAVRVDGVRWHESEALIFLGPTDPAYTLRIGAAEATSVLFGDGVHGARVPTGVENVTATYRIGGGSSGNVDAGKISQLASRPLGVNSVGNPLPATGGTDGDGPADARITIPLRMQALDRLVSTQDYQDFTRARAGIGKASASRLFDGEREVVHVTIAAIGDAPVDPSSELFTNLQSALADLGDPHLPVRVDVRDLVLIVLSADVKVLPDYSWDLVEPMVRAAVLDILGFAYRELAEPAFLSEVVAAMQAVPGVDYVDIDVFDGIAGDTSPIDLVRIADRLSRARPCVPAAPASYEETVHTVEVDPTGKLDTLTSIARRFGRTVDELVRLNPGLDHAELAVDQQLVVFRGIRPAQLVVLSPDVPDTLTLRRIP